MDKRPTSRVVALAMLAIVAGACTDSSTGPGAAVQFDAAQALADYETVDAVLASSGWTSFRRTSPFMAKSTVAGFVAADLIADVTAGRAVGPVAGVVRADAPVISDRNRGKTFAYDPVSDDYVHDPTRTGAPSNGVRFILYEETGSGRPNPEREMGFADLVDLGDGSAADIALRLEATYDGLRVLDYSVSVTQAGDGGSIGVDGYIQSPEDRLDFDIAIEGSGPEGQGEGSVRFALRVDRRDFEVSGTVTGDNTGSVGRGAWTLVVRHGSDELRLSAEGSEDFIEASFRINGELFATAQGDPDDPEVSSADGDPLTGPEWEVLVKVLRTAEDVHELLEDLLEPAAFVVLVGVLL